MTKNPNPTPPPRRERQIMDILYKLERASVGHVLSNLADKPSYSTVRAQLRVLEEKGHVRHEEQGLRYVYVPAVPRDVARDRKSTRLNSSHGYISYAVFCLKKKKTTNSTACGDYINIIPIYAIISLLRSPYSYRVNHIASFFFQTTVLS